MKKIILLIVSLFLIGQSLAAVPSSALQNKCMRAMTPEELTKESQLIVRVKVTRVDPATYLGLYDQIATLKITEVVDGDTSLKGREIKVWAKSRVPCAEDAYVLNDELLIFLVREITFYRTLNYQYGQFHVQNEQVMGWRDKDKGEIAKNFPEVATEIRSILFSHSGDTGGIRTAPIVSAHP
jgi:hypothetical protein